MFLFKLRGMKIRGVLVLVLIAWGSFCQAQVGVDMNFGVAPWRIAHNMEDLSSSVSLGYAGSLTIESFMQDSDAALLTGIEYFLAEPSDNYADLSNEENLMAVAFANTLKQQYFAFNRHEITIPLMYVFYHNNLRSGFGVSYTMMYFEDYSRPILKRVINDFGVRAFTGARLSKRMLFTINYYYGVNKIVVMHANETGFEGNEFNLTGHMHQVKVTLGISLFNNFDGSRCFLSGN